MQKKLARITDKMLAIILKHRDGSNNWLSTDQQVDLDCLRIEYNRLTLRLNYCASVACFMQGVKFNMIPQEFADKFIHPDERV